MNMVSVIICTYNRVESLQDTLTSLKKAFSTCEKTRELIVVDNNSHDATKQAVKNFADSSSDTVKYVFEERQGYSYARNRGIHEAKGEIIAFVDDDVFVDSHWLTNMSTCFQQYQCDAVGGRVLPFYPAKTPQWVKDNKVLLQGPIAMYDYGEEIYPLRSSMSYPITANIAIKKHCFERVGLFRTDLERGEDEEFVGRLKQHKSCIYYNGKMLAWHKVSQQRMTYRYFARWYFSAGRAATRMYHPIQGTPRCYWGIPKPCVNAVVKHSIFFMLHFLNRKKALEQWQIIFKSMGIGYEYRILKRTPEKALHNDE